MAKYFFPDSQDLVDPSFQFDTEKRSNDRLRHRDDAYAHEIFSTRAYDGMLVSKGIVDGFGATGSRYTLAQRHRLLRSGIQEFLRIQNSKFGPLPVMGDCGAFTYVKEEKPPYTVDEVLEFYVSCGFDLAVSVDHVILAYQPSWDKDGQVPADIKYRQEITFELAKEFLDKRNSSSLKFEPLGVAQGWSPQSYAHAVKTIQDIGYDYIALGGMVPLKTQEILACLEAISQVRKPNTRLHLLGVTRVEQINRFADYGVASFDSTSPLRQAFKDDKDNFYTLDRAYTAIRVPQVEGNPDLLRKITAGKINQEKARQLEKACLAAMKSFDAGQKTVEDTVSILRAYEELYDPKKDHSEAYREVLEAKPWQTCECDVCQTIKHHVIMFRGAERNRRRGFHNVWVFYRRLQRETDLVIETPSTNKQTTLNL
jgi:hypothetical protein